MSESSNTPNPFDLVLGGNNPPKRKSGNEKSSISELEQSPGGCLVILKWLFYGWITSTILTDSNPYFNHGLANSIGSLAASAWILGLFCPSLVIRFGLPKSRLAVTAIYLPIYIISTLVSS